MSAVHAISRTAQNPSRIAGILLVSSFLVLLIALVILIVSGALPAFSAGLQGSLVEMAPYADTFGLLNLFWTAGWVFQLMGFGMLTWLLMRAGDAPLTIPAFIAILIAAILGILHGTFHMSVETWASLEAARTGHVPEAYEALRLWIGSAFRIAYVLHLLGTVGFGLSFLHAGILRKWVGQLAIGWGTLWAVVYLIGAGVPAILFIMPAVVGVALLRPG